ncbi:uncharacterized protein [Nicotiana tomentosiformis]|uniref:uncharacterized protein n=1 Tax=Nicotiana tomentosiformis TaxID=4098 RepID=UPI00388C9E64
MGSLAYILVGKRLLAVDVQALSNQFIRLDVLEPSRVLACTIARSSLYKGIREWQYDDPHMLILRSTVRHGGAKQVTVGDDRVLRMQGRICVPNVDRLREFILEEAHSSRYSIHLGAAKMYQDLTQHYWRRRMNKDIVAYVAQCLNCQQVKYEHQRPDGLLKKLETPEWKWERISMYFFVGLPWTQRKFDTITIERGEEHCDTLKRGKAKFQFQQLSFQLSVISSLLLSQFQFQHLQFFLSIALHTSAIQMY